MDARVDDDDGVRAVGCDLVDESGAVSSELKVSSVASFKLERRDEDDGLVGNSESGDGEGVSFEFCSYAIR